MLTVHLGAYQMQLFFHWKPRSLNCKIKRAPTVNLRTPRPATEPRNGPTRNFHEKYRKNTPRPEILDSRIYPQNTPKIPKKYPQNTKNAHFWYFFGIFGVFSWGSRISAPGVFFQYFWGKLRVGPSRVSLAGRGVLNCK